jgi:hypothetical protein
MSPLDQYALSVETDDPIAQVTVYDGNLNVVARGTGKLAEKLPAGMYRIRARVGSAVAEQLRALDGDQTVKFDPLPFVSPIPLRCTEKTHEYHMAGAAAAASRIPARALGTGASIMVFSRDWSVQGNMSTGNPAEGLSLLDSNENVLAEIGTEAEIRHYGDVCAGWRADVNPGSYFLRLQIGETEKTILQRPIFVSPGHQIQVFSLVGDQSIEEAAGSTDEKGEARRERITVRRADLANASVAISSNDRAISPNGWAFDPDDRRARLGELACNALTQSRGELAQPLIDELAREQFNNPMLGLFAAHLLLKDRPNDKETFRTITDNLLRMLGPDHPDLQALWWQRGDDSRLGDGRLHVLPMLRASWSLAVDRSIQKLDVFSLGTFYDKLTRLVPSAPWLMMMDNDWAVSDAAVDNYIKVRATAKRRVSRAEAVAALRATALRDQYVKRAYSTIRDMLPTKVAAYLPEWSPQVAATPKTPSGEAHLESIAPSPESAAPPLESDERADLARSLAIPKDLLEAILTRKGHK